jgi:hypothetical protein
MRFKAKLVNDQLALLHSVIAPISKLQDPNRFAVLYLDEDYIRISCKTSESGITCFAELSQKDLFVEHRIESAADNVIVCQVDLVSLRMAFQPVVQGSSSSNNGQQYQQQRGGRGDGTSNSNNSSALQSLLSGQQVVILKLAKRNNRPCICLEGRTSNNDDVEVHQAIPVRIMRQAEMQNHLPPQINHPQVQLELPFDRPIRPVIEKLKGMGKYGTNSKSFSVPIYNV